MIRQDEINITLPREDLNIILGELDGAYFADEELLDSKEDVLGLVENDAEYTESLQQDIEDIKDRMNENRRVLEFIQRELQKNLST
ncbi:hypothetical protein [Thermoactinomyces sp. DSM 45891]|uniref:hypothetical protein n=1 Tax=Thermoactinomyces sp. DSM 45891 TaxID=1761907 RepID=UPI000931FC52|nr:hypothetical protein [Thermoactinomyces sp. DSM 45891]